VVTDEILDRSFGARGTKLGYLIRAYHNRETYIGRAGVVNRALTVLAKA